MLRNIPEQISNKALQVLRTAVVRILRPLVRILLRYGVSYGTFAEIAKVAYVDIASNEFGIEGRRQTVSRASVLTGLSRKEVQRVAGLPATDDRVIQEGYNRAARVLTGWIKDPEFLDEQGKPAALLVEGSGATFGELVKRYSGDVPVRAILDELLRVGAISVHEDNRVGLLKRAYIPQRGEPEKIAILGTDVAHLISTIDHNLQPEAGKPLFQREVTYDNLPDEMLSAFRALSAEKAQALLELLDKELAEKDRDTNPSAKGSGRNRVGVGIYYFEQPYTEGD